MNAQAAASAVGLRLSIAETSTLIADYIDAQGPRRTAICRRELDVGGARVSRWIGDLDLDQYRWIVCVGHDEAERVRFILGATPANVIVANEDQGGIPDPYDLGVTGYRNCLALLDQVMPPVARRISEAGSAARDGG